MAVNDDIRFVKGSYDVTLFTAKITENIKNQLVIVAGKGGQSKSNQSEGPKPTMIVDMLKITDVYHIEAYITKTTSQTAKEIKDDMREIARGAKVDGGDVIMYYEDEQIGGYIENLTIDKTINDDLADSGYSGNDGSEYHIVIGFIKGVGL